MHYRVKSDGVGRGCVDVILVFDHKQYVLNMTQEEFDELSNKAICRALMHMHDFGNNSTSEEEKEGA